MELSYSTINVFDQCKRWFYLSKIKKQRVPEETKFKDRGSVVHTSIEYYYKNKCDNETLFRFFNAKWKEFNLDKTMAIAYAKTWEMVLLAAKKNIDYTNIEFKIRLDEPKIVGFLDMINTKTHFIYDWKTGNFKNLQEYEDQMKMYSYLYYKIFGVMPTCELIYLMPDKTNRFVFTKSIVDEIEHKIIKTNNFIETYKEDINAFIKCEDNPKQCPHFCPYKKECFSNVSEFVSNINEIIIQIKNNYCFLQGYMHPLLLEGLDQELKYDKKNKYFMQTNSRRYGIKPGTPEYEDYGTVHLFNRKYKMFCVGHLQTVIDVLKQYSEYSKNEIKITVDDQRNTYVMGKKLGTMPDKLKTDKILRDYQLKAVEKFLEKGMGFLEMATGSGKTMVTAEIIRRLDTTTLWIVDRKEILYQTRDVFKSMLGVDIGVIGDGEVDYQNVTVATIQTLSNVQKFKDYLNQINFVIVDEAHHAAATTYQRVFYELKNTKYRLGTTATATRDDGDSPVLFSLIGDIIYKISSKELENEGYLMKPKIVFYKIEGEFDNYLPYAEAYTKYIVQNEKRNFRIQEIVKSYHDKKVLILTNRIEHGKYLSLLLGCKFIFGSLKKIQRSTDYQEFKSNDTGVLVGTQSIFSEGVDIPDLDVVINAGANSGDVKTVQSIGRVLRTHEGKDQAVYIDFMDSQKYLKRASSKRLKILQEEEHEVEFK